MNGAAGKLVGAGEPLKTVGVSPGAVNEPETETSAAPSDRQKFVSSP
jgi:hypothetical protein